MKTPSCPHSASLRLLLNTITNRLLLFVAFLMFSQHGHAQTYLPVTTTWTGNTFNGGPQTAGSQYYRYMQTDIWGIYVAPDGTVYAHSYYTEGGKDVGIYKDGKSMGFCTKGGDANLCRGAITGDAYTIYFEGESDRGQGSTVTDYFVQCCMPDGTVVPGNTKLNIESQPHALQGLLVNSITGLALSGTSLFVADRYAGVVKVYNKDLSTYTWVSGSCPAPLQTLNVTSAGETLGHITLDTYGNLWVIKTGTNGSSGVYCYSTGGSGTLIQSITNLDEPSGLTINNTGQLMVVDSGSNMQIYTYTITGSTNTCTGTFGTKGGILAGSGSSIGQTAPGKLNYPVDVGVDGQGNIYVASPKSTLESYTSGTAPTLRWKLEGVAEITSVVQPAPASSGSETDVYGANAHYKFDYTKRSGDEWSYQGNTKDEFNYPDDARDGMTTAFQGAFNIKGKTFVGMSNQSGAQLALYRFDAANHGETAIPCGLFVTGWTNPRSWPRAAGSGALSGTFPAYPSSWLWMDANGNGIIEASEYEIVSGTDGAGTWRVDSAGNVWQCRAYDASGNDYYLREYKAPNLSGTYNVPIYSSTGTNSVKYTLKPPFNVTKSIGDFNYDANNDVMYVSGFTATYPSGTTTTGGTMAVHGNNQIGRLLCRYTHWCSGTTTLTGSAVLAYSGSNHCACASAFAGDYYFVGYFDDHSIQAYNVSGTAPTYVGDILVGQQCNVPGVFIDSVRGLTAYKRANGEYIISLEAGYVTNQETVIRWFPQASAPPAPTNLRVVDAQSTTISLAWTGASGATGYQVEQKIYTPSSGFGAWTLAGTVSGTTYVGTFLTGTNDYSYRVRATNGSGYASDYSATVVVPGGNTSIAVGPFISDSFTTSGTALEGRGPLQLDVDLPHSTYYAVGNVVGNGFPSISGNAASLKGSVGACLSIAAPSGTSSYLRPSIMNISARLNPQNMTGTSSAAMGMGLGFYSGLEGIVANQNFTGLVLNRNGDLSFISGTWSQTVAHTGGTFTENQWHALSYTVNSRVGSFYNVVLDGTSISFSPTNAFNTTVAPGTGYGGILYDATLYAGFYAIDDQGGRSGAGLVDDFKVSFPAVAADAFSGTTNSLLLGRTPDGGILSGGTYMESGSAAVYGHPYINGARAFLNGDMGASVSIASTSTYVKPQVINISGVLDPYQTSGTTQRLNGLGLGFYSSANGAHGYTSFNGLTLNPDGYLTLVENGVPVSSVAYTGGWTESATHNLSYTVNTSDGSISNVVLDRNSVFFSSSAFSDTATARAGFYVSSGTAMVFSFNVH